MSLLLYAVVIGFKRFTTLLWVSKGTMTSSPQHSFWFYRLLHPHLETLDFATWWLIPRIVGDKTPAINGIRRVNPLSEIGMSQQVDNRL